MKRRNKGIPPTTAARHATREAAGIAAAIAAAPQAETAALTFWRDNLWQAADSVGIKPTDDQLEAMAADLVVAARNAPGNDE